MSEQTDDASTDRRITKAVGVAVWLAACSYMGLSVIEFGAAVDGVGYAHLKVPTYVTVVLLHGIVAAIVVAAYNTYRGAIGGVAGFLLGVGFCISVMVVAGLSLDKHYARICDTADAPTACYAVSWHCQQDAEDICAARLGRACTWGDQRGCEQLLDSGAWSTEQVCEALATSCERTRRCGTYDAPAHCDKDSVGSYEAYKVSRVCEVYRDKCAPDDAP
jgi:hypothetical protein